MLRRSSRIASQSRKKEEILPKTRKRKQSAKSTKGKKSKISRGSSSNTKKKKPNTKKKISKKSTKKNTSKQTENGSKKKSSESKKSRKQSNKESKKIDIEENQSSSSNKGNIKQITINRAPVLTLWVAVVANQLGLSWETGLTLGKAIAGLFAFTKGRSLGLMEPSEKTKQERASERGQHFLQPILHAKVPCRNTSDGIRALAKGKPINPQAVQKYLEGKFGKEELKYAKNAMEYLVKSYRNTDELNTDAYHLYEQFRPTVVAGTKGWGRRNTLDLNYIRSLAK